MELAFDRWLKGDGNGKRSGKPRFKGVGQYKTFTYPQFKQHHFVGNRITLPKIGVVKVIVHRQLPDGFVVKTVSVTKKQDGYYVTLSLDNNEVPTIKPDFNVNNIVGLDLGLIDFYVDSDNNRVAAPKYLRKAERKLKFIQRQAQYRTKVVKRGKVRV